MPQRVHTRALAAGALASAGRSPQWPQNQTVVLGSSGLRGTNAKAPRRLGTPEFVIQAPSELKAFVYILAVRWSSSIP
jgi:hypothetical protein